MVCGASRPNVSETGHQLASRFAQSHGLKSAAADRPADIARAPTERRRASPRGSPQQTADQVSCRFATAIPTADSPYDTCADRSNLATTYAAISTTMITASALISVFAEDEFNLNSGKSSSQPLRGLKLLCSRDPISVVPLHSSNAVQEWLEAIELYRFLALLHNVNRELML